MGLGRPEFFGSSARAMLCFTKSLARNQIATKNSLRSFVRRIQSGVQLSAPICVNEDQKPAKKCQSNTEIAERNVPPEKKSLISEKQKNNYQKNKEAHKQYYQDNKEVIARRNKQYREQNKEMIAMSQKKYYEANKEQIAERQKKLRYREPKSLRKSWKTATAVRENLDAIAEALSIQVPTDWYRISYSQLAQMGGRSIRERFGSLFEVLKIGYPEQQWDETDFAAKNKKASQRWLLVQVQELLPEGTEIIEEYKLPHPTGPYELDIWIPEYKIALEYQGEIHYREYSETIGLLDQRQKRDRVKMSTCEKEGITLVCIPYWWDHRRGSLQATLHSRRPDLFNKSQASPIPEIEPRKPKSVILTPALMHGNPWVDQDPTGWILSEKLDGLRCFWTGSSLITRNGYAVSAPDSFISSLPKDIALDGELWCGYQTLSETRSILLRSRWGNRDPKIWDNVQFRVFDAPHYKAYYQERHAFAESVLPPDGHQISVIPIQTCKGLTHLFETLDSIRSKQGEGIMLYDPASFYSAGRSNLVQKILLRDESIVSFESRGSKGHTFCCRQDDGASCLVKCRPVDYFHPPPVGLKLKVRHLGKYVKTGKLKDAVLLQRIRRDLTPVPIHTILDSSEFSDSITPTLLTFDVETNDHPQKDPFMIELGWCLFDQQGKILNGYPKSYLISPHHQFGPTYIDLVTEQEFHGINMEQLNKEGKPFAEVFKLFLVDLEKVVANESGRIACYNLEFDQKMLIKSVQGMKLSAEERIQTLLKEKGFCVKEQVSKMARGRVRLGYAFQKYSKLPNPTKLQLLEQAHHAKTDSVITGLVFFALNQKSANK